MGVVIEDRCFNTGSISTLNHFKVKMEYIKIDATLVIMPYVNLTERGFHVYFENVNGRHISIYDTPAVSFSESRYSDPDKNIVVYKGYRDYFDKHGIPTEEVWEKAEFHIHEAEAAHSILTYLTVNHPKIGKTVNLLVNEAESS